IVIFDPELPSQSRIQFDAGGSCISIEGTKRLAKAESHWSGELKGALAAGKSVFVRLSPYEEDQAAYGSTHPAKNRTTYQTTVINNYTVIPGNVRVRNARGRSIAVKDSAYKGLYE